MHISQYLSDMERTARLAGDYIMGYYGTVIDVGKDISGKNSIRGYTDAMHQSEKSALSQVDKEAQRIIMERLLKQYDSCGIHAEESSEEIEKLQTRFTHLNTLPDNKYTFIVDPIDGTRNFLNTNPKNRGRGGDISKCDYFAVGIHLALGKHIVAGVFYFPALRIMLTTCEGMGTYINGEKVVLSHHTSPQFSDPVRVGKTVPELQSLFSCNIAYGSSCGVLLALLKGQIIAYFVKEVDILDFGCTALAYREAQGFVGDVFARSLEVSDFIVEIKDFNNNPVILVRGFLALTSTKKYLENLVKMIFESGVDLARVAKI